MEVPAISHEEALQIRADLVAAGPTSCAELNLMVRIEAALKQNRELSDQLRRLSAEVGAVAVSLQEFRPPASATHLPPAHDGGRWHQHAAD